MISKSHILSALGYAIAVCGPVLYFKVKFCLYISELEYLYLIKKNYFIVKILFCYIEAA
jgi:hypothetical protein